MRVIIPSIHIKKSPLYTHNSVEKPVKMLADKIINEKEFIYTKDSTIKC